MLENIILFFAAYIAAIFATIAGFGSSTLLIPVAIFFMDMKTAVVLVACFHLFNNLFKVKLFFHNIDRRIFIIFGLPSILLAFLGAQCLTLFSGESLKVMLGLFLIIFALYSFWKPQLKVKDSFWLCLIGGGLSGFLAGLIGLGGAIRAFFLINLSLDKKVFIATSALIAFVVDITRIPTYFFANVVEDKSYFRLLPFLLIIAYLGVSTGKHLLEKIDQEYFRKIVLGALLFGGIKIFLG